MISVVICTYNRSKMLLQTLESLNTMQIAKHLAWELVVVDNNSKDDTKECVEEFSKTAAFRLRYVFEGKQGLSNARNAGIDQCKGEIIAFTDDDVTVDSRWLAELRSAFDDYDCMAVGGRIVPVWTLPKPSWYGEDGSSRLMGFITQFDLGGLRREIKNPPFGANMAFKRAAFHKYGLFRTDLGRSGGGLLHGEDTEFGERLIRAGEKLVYAPEAVVYHPVEKERTKKKYCQRWYFTFGRTAMRRSGKPAETVCYFGIPRYLLRNFATGLCRWAFTLPAKARFQRKLALYRIAGEIAEAHNMSA